MRHYLSQKYVFKPTFYIYISGFESIRLIKSGFEGFLQMSKIAAQCNFFDIYQKLFNPDSGIYRLFQFFSCGSLSSYPA